MTSPQKLQLPALSELIKTVHRLRAPGGCPWDRAQTHQSLRKHLVEEAYEVLDVLDQIHSPEDLKIEKISRSFQEELGDLLMQVLLHSELAHETGVFDIYDVAKVLNEKLIRRHPHVFGESKAESAEIALQTWEREKAKERATQIEKGVLDGLPRNLPALQRTARLLEKVTSVGFQWKTMEGPLAKVEEELTELKIEIAELETLIKNSKLIQPPTSEFLKKESQLRKKVESELGDLFFSLCNVAYLLKINPETSLRSTLTQFEKRFRYVEKSIQAQGKKLEDSNLEEMDHYWNEAKILEKTQVWGLTGGIASGKSAVGKFLFKMGIPVIDADQIARELSGTDGLAYPAILKRFGTADRNHLREIIFSNPKEKSDLEDILHPLIQKESHKKILALAPYHSVIIYEATLLIETGRYQELQGLITVEAPEPLRISRLISRNGVSHPTAEKIVRSQSSEEFRRKYSNIVLENSASLEELQSQVAQMVTSQKWK